MNSENANPTEHRYLVRPGLNCRGCGYDLRGLASEGQCPECGLGIWETIKATVDPAASRLPRIGNPKGVGNAIIVIAVALFLATIVLSLSSLLELIEWLTSLQSGRLMIWLPSQPPLVAAIVLAIACVWVIRLAPRRGDPTVRTIWRHICVLAAGLLACALISGWWYWKQRHVGSSGGIVLVGRGEVWRISLRIGLMIGAMISLTGFRAVIRTIGQRSRAFRTARGGRQRINTLVVAIVAAAVGDLIRLIAITADAKPVWHVLGTLILAISGLMVIIGLGYLVVNVWWIRRALHKPAPRLDEVLLNEREIKETDQITQ